MINAKFLKFYGVRRKDVESINKMNNSLYKFACRRFHMGNYSIGAKIYDDQENPNTMTEYRSFFSLLELKWFCYYNTHIVRGRKIYFESIG